MLPNAEGTLWVVGPGERAGLAKLIAEAISAPLKISYSSVLTSTVSPTRKNSMNGAQAARSGG